MDLSERPSHASQTDRRHPWEVARFRFFQRVLTEGALAPVRVLDAGAGDGWFIQQLLGCLPSEVAVTCWDAHYAPATLDALRADAPERVRFTAEQPSDNYDLITLLDVLEHVEDDAAFLARLLRRNLAPGGSLLVSVPAWQALFTSHDSRLRHHRRYSPAAALRLLERSGLSVVRRGGLFHTLLLPRAAEKARELVLAERHNKLAAPPSLSWHGGALVTQATELVLAADNRLSLWASTRGLELPGLSWWALCRRS